MCEDRRKQLVHNIAKESFNAGSFLTLEAMAKTIEQWGVVHTENRAFLIELAIYMRQPDIIEALNRKAEQYADNLIREVEKGEE